MKRKLMLSALVVLLAASAWFLQRDTGDVRDRESRQAPREVELALAAMGGFRGVFSEFVWFRADRLQEEGRFTELAQLAMWLTYLEPHSSEMWSYASWNLAYNISSSMPTPEDRWRWVWAGVELLQKDALRMNPRDARVYKDLAWLYFAKVAGKYDSAGQFYRNQWAMIVDKAEKNGDWSATAMNGWYMGVVEGKYGKLEWRNPEMAALYWAELGLDTSRGPGMVDLKSFRNLILKVCNMGGGA